MRVWNRACFEHGGPAKREGDTALAALLLAHGLVMNGGLFHAVGCLREHELSAPCQGFSYFGFAAVIAVLKEAYIAVGTSRESGSWR
jgi:hypothetical protein